MTLIAEAGYWSGRKLRTLKTHRNPGFEIVCVTGGCPVWHVDNIEYEVPSGSVFFTWPWEWHGDVRNTDTGVDLCFVVIRLDRVYRRPPASVRFHREMSLQPDTARKIKKTLLHNDNRVFRLTERMLWLTRTLVDQAHRHDPLSRASLGPLAAAAMIELTHSVLDSTPQPPQRKTDATRKRVNRFIQRLRQECHNPWSVESMAVACRLSRSRLTEIIRAETGDPPLLLLNRFRIHKAQQMLRETDRNLTDIALSCGFNSSQYFCRVFRDYTDMTPTEFRNAQRT